MNFSVKRKLTFSNGTIDGLMVENGLLSYLSPHTELSWQRKIVKIGDGFSF